MKTSFLLPVMIIALTVACEQKKSTTAYGNDSTSTEMTTKTEVTTTQEQDTTDFSTRMKQESEEVKKKLEALRVKAKQKGGKLGQDINKKVDSWDIERKDFSAKETKDNLKEDWAKFKEKVETAVDSLDKKI